MDKTKSKASRIEWERQRRNKFNDAINKLGEIVKEIYKSNSAVEKESEAQYPKIEIVQKAIICLTNCVQEKTQLKAEVLALQVKLDTIEASKFEKKDVSLQVNIRSRRGKIKQSTKPPLLLPISYKKDLQNTLVVLPATPYLLPQRPLFMPPAPTIVLVDSNVQTQNKSQVPVVNRVIGDVTKTTMVNILPISAYSRPISVGKPKKANIKVKPDCKKGLKKSKVIKECKKLNTDKPENCTPKTSTENIVMDMKIVQTLDKDEKKEQNKDNVKTQDVQVAKDSVNKTDKNNTLKKSVITNEKNTEKLETTEIKTVPPKNAVDNTNEKQSISKIEKQEVKPLPKTQTTTNFNETKNVQNIPSDKTKINLDKDKENKLTNILENPLCENVVDAGNARLELAEEFLAASPTAAFLMSFPVVSGNRADSPVEDTHTEVSVTKENVMKRSEVEYFDKTDSLKVKVVNNNKTESVIENEKLKDQHMTLNNTANKQVDTKDVPTTISNPPENPFLPMTSLIPSTCTLTESNFNLDFDCNLSKPLANQTSKYEANSNLFYKNDTLGQVKNAIYSTSSISTSHDFNALGLYPCAVEKYSSKNKPDLSSVEDNLMKIGSSRLTYDIDLGWSQKSLDFISCSTAANNYAKDGILTNASTPYSTTYNPFNPEFHMISSSCNKKDVVSTKTNAPFADSVASVYSQPTSLWSEDVPFYTNNAVPKILTTKPQNYLHLDHAQMNTNFKPNQSKHFLDAKPISDVNINNTISKLPDSQVTSNEKYTKKSPSKMHINWMTSEIRPLQSSTNCHSNNIDTKSSLKPTYSHIEQTPKKHEQTETNYFPISVHNFPTQTPNEEFQMWPSTRPAGTTEITIEPPPITLPTLVGDLALGPHEKRKNAELNNRASQQDIQNCGNFLSVTQLMNRSSDNMNSRYHNTNVNPPKVTTTKTNLPSQNLNDNSRKVLPNRIDASQNCYVFNNNKINSYENSFPQTNSKNSKLEKKPKLHKNNYSAESLIRGGNCNQKIQDCNNKFLIPPQQYNTTADNSVAQVSHFPPIIDYPENNFPSQQFSGTTLYNSTTNTISNSFYTNFMPTSSNLMSTNYASGPFSTEFIDYNNQTTECSYTNYRYDDLKIRNNPTMFQQEKGPSNYKSSRRESGTKHKLECSKKESNKKYQSKRAKLNNESEDWNDTSHVLWQNKNTNKRHSNFVSEELTFPNYVANQMSSQYQAEFFNSHLMSSNMQGVGSNVDRSISSFPITSRANFNLSTIFPEITMKVQS